MSNRTVRCVPVFARPWFPQIRRRRSRGSCTWRRLLCSTDGVGDDGINHAVRVARQQKFRDQPGPAGLVRGACTAARVSMEVLVEQHVIAEMRIALHSGMVSMHGTQSVLAPQKD